MQRRVATVYFLFFIVMAASAYSVIVVAEEPAVRIEGETYAENETFTLDGRQYTVTKAALESSGGGGHGGGGGASYAGTIAWTNGTEQRTVSFGEGDNVTLSGTTYLVHFRGEGDDVRVTLAPAETAYADYQRQLARQDYFHERMNGLWGVVILSVVTAMLLVGLAMLPRKG